jgi:hypothetical protein
LKQGFLGFSNAKEKLAGRKAAGWPEEAQAAIS